jgi:hypothetical protein
VAPSRCSYRPSPRARARGGGVRLKGLRGANRKSPRRAARCEPEGRREGPRGWRRRGAAAGPHRARGGAAGACLEDRAARTGRAPRRAARREPEGLREGPRGWCRQGAATEPHRARGGVWPKGPRGANRKGAERGRAGGAVKVQLPGLTARGGAALSGWRGRAEQT